MGSDQDQRAETEVAQTTRYRSEIDKAVDEKRLVGSPGYTRRLRLMETGHVLPRQPES